MAAPLRRKKGGQKRAMREKKVQGRMALRLEKVTEVVNRLLPPCLEEMQEQGRWMDAQREMGMKAWDKDCNGDNVLPKTPKRLKSSARRHINTTPSPTQEQPETPTHTLEHDGQTAGADDDDDGRKQDSPTTDARDDDGHVHKTKSPPAPIAKRTRMTTRQTNRQLQPPAADRRLADKQKSSTRSAQETAKRARTRAANRPMLLSPDEDGDVDRPKTPTPVVHEATKRQTRATTASTASASSRAAKKMPANPVKKTKANEPLPPMPAATPVKKGKVNEPLPPPSPTRTAKEKTEKHKREREDWQQRQTQEMIAQPKQRAVPPMPLRVTALRNAARMATTSYDMTPSPVAKVKSADDYGIDDLNSGDETDDDQTPKKPIPQWAQGAELKEAMIRQHSQPPPTDLLTARIEEPDLSKMFAVPRARFTKRTSSAAWDSPLWNPAKATEQARAVLQNRQRSQSCAKI